MENQEPVPADVQEIQREMEDTRSALAEKLETLEQKVAGVVGAVEQVTSSVSETVENIKDTVTETVSNIKETVSETSSTVSAVTESVQEGVKSVGENAKKVITEHLNFADFVDEHPYYAVGGAAAVGFLLGSMLGGASTSSMTRAMSEASAPTPSTTSGSHDNGNGIGYERRRSASAYTSPSAAASEGSIGSTMTNLFGQEMQKLKGLALGTLFGIAREFVSNSLPPAMGTQVKSIIDDITEKMGGSTLPSSAFADWLPKGNEDSSSERTGPQMAGAGASSMPHTRRAWDDIGPNSH